MESKEALLDGIGDLALGDLELPDLEAGDWRDQLRSTARSFRFEGQAVKLPCPRIVAEYRMQRPKIEWRWCVSVPSNDPLLNVTATR